MSETLSQTTQLEALPLHEMHPLQRAEALKNALIENRPEYWSHIQSLGPTNLNPGQPPTNSVQSNLPTVNQEP